MPAAPFMYHWIFHSGWFLAAPSTDVGGWELVHEALHDGRGGLHPRRVEVALVARGVLVAFLGGEPQ